MLISIILTFMKIGILSFGGGYVAIPLVEKNVVEINKWMSYSEFADIISIDELTPGPIAINAATFVGNKMSGLIGGVVATLGTIIPSCIIALILVKLYYKYRSLKYVNGALNCLKAMVVALIVSTTISISKNVLFKNGLININCVDYISLTLSIISLLVLRKYKINPIITMIGCGIIGLIIYSI